MTSDKGAKVIQLRRMAVITNGAGANGQQFPPINEPGPMSHTLYKINWKWIIDLFKMDYFGQRSQRGVLNTSHLKNNSLKKKKSNSDFHQKWKQPKCPSMD